MMCQQRSIKHIVGGLAALIAAVWVAGGRPASAACVANTNTGVTVDSFRSDVQPPIKGQHMQAQTFTVEGSGCYKLDQVTVSVRRFGNPGDLVVEIYNVVAGEPALPSLAAATVPQASVPTGSYTDIIVPFVSPPELSGGSQYALVVHTLNSSGNGTNFYQLGLAAGDPYAGGRYCRSGSGNNWACPNGPQDGMDVRMSLCLSPCCNSPCGVCTRTQGYWKTHPGSWPVSSLTLGSVAYTQAELLSILHLPVMGNGLISLAHQLIAAKLNIANGASAPPGVTAAIAAADTMIGGLGIPPVGSGYLHPSVTSALTGTLDIYNNGLYPGGPAHCE